MDVIISDSFCTYKYVFEDDGCFSIQEIADIITEAKGYKQLYVDLVDFDEY